MLKEMKGWNAQALQELLNGKWYIKPESDEWQAKSFAVNQSGVIEPDTVFVAVDSETWRKSSGNTSFYEGSDDVLKILKDFGDKIGDKIIGIITQKPILELNIPQLLVRNAYDVFQNLAWYARQKMTGVIISITGTTDKALVKNMIAHCVEGDYSWISTKDDHNTDTDIYLTVAKCIENPDFCLLEAGMSALRMRSGSISIWVRPHICVITEVKTGATAFHKARICEGMESGGSVIIYGDMKQLDYICAEVGNYGATPVIYGMNPSYDSHIVSWSRTEKGTKINAVILGEKVEYIFPLARKAVIVNSIAALTAIKLSGLDIQTLSRKLQNYPLMDKVKILKAKTSAGVITIIDDSYNAKTPSMMTTAFEILCEEAERGVKTSRKIVVLNKISNIGGKTKELNKLLAELLVAADVDMVFGYSDEVRYLLDELPEGMAAGVYFDAESLANVIYEYLGDHDYVLIEGLRDEGGFDKVKDILLQNINNQYAAYKAIQLSNPALAYSASDPEETAAEVSVVNSQMPACSIYSLDKKTMLLSSNENLKIDEGLGSVLLLSLALQQVYDKRMKLVDDVVVQKWAADERDKNNALRLTHKEVVPIGLLLEAIVVSNAPDALLALSDRMNKLHKRPIRERLKEMAQNLILSQMAFKSITGRKNDKFEQSFYLSDVNKVAVDLFSQPLDLLKPLKTVFVTHNGKYLETDSILHTVNGILYYFCFGYQLYHVIAMAKLKTEDVCICVCGAKTPYERDAAVCKLLFEREEAAMPKVVWHPMGKKETAEAALTIAGDTYLGEWRDNKAKNNEEKEIAASTKEGYAISFDKIRDLLNPDSFNVLNFETVLTKQKKSPYRRYLPLILNDEPSRIVPELKTNHIRAVMLANNHSMDFGDAGCRQTLAAFRSKEILTAGSGRNVNDAEKPLFLTAGERQVLFFNVCRYERTRHYVSRQYAMGDNPGIACLSNLYCATIQKYKKEYPHAFIILSPHWGADYSDDVSEMRNMASQLISAGVDCIIGHGSRMISGIEMIHGKFVLYSLGDFIFNKSSNYPYGYIAKLYFRAESIEVRIYPFIIRNVDDCLQPNLVDEELFQEITQAFSIHPDMIRQDKSGFHFAVKLK